MSGYGYLFRFPASMPKLTFDGLAVLRQHGTYEWQRHGRIGSTVTVHHEPATETSPERYRFRLYSTSIAWIGKDTVHFGRHGDHHQATRMWLEQIARDNGLAHGVYRNHRGVLEMDGGHPVEGHTYPVGVWLTSG